MCIPLVLACIPAGGFQQGSNTAPASVLDAPFGKRTRLASPDGRYVLFFLAADPVSQTSPELWIEDTRTTKRVRLLELGGTARAEWSPDGTWFSVDDRWASDSANSYLYEAATLRRLDIKEAILAVDREAARFAAGHAYFEVERWESTSHVVVDFHGHTDEAPVACFDLRYRVTRTGSVVMLARRISPVTSAGCR